MTRLIMVSGSMAAGKSTTAALVTSTLRDRGLSVAATALDEVADMARPTLPDWDWAHHIHAQLVGLWAATGIDVVVDEECSTLVEVQQVVAAIPPQVDVFHVVLDTGFDEALVRAQADPTRGLSKEPDFLRSQYDDFAREQPTLPADVRIHVSDVTTEQVVHRVVERWDARTR